MAPALRRMHMRDRAARCLASAAQDDIFLDIEIDINIHLAAPAAPAVRCRHLKKRAAAI